MNKDKKDIERTKLIALKLSDLNSIISFKEWLSENISKFESAKPSSEEILILLSYLKEKIFEQKLEDKKEYLKSIKKIKLRIMAEEKNEK